MSNRKSLACCPRFGFTWHGGLSRHILKHPWLKAMSTGLVEGRITSAGVPIGRHKESVRSSLPKHWTCCGQRRRAITSSHHPKLWSFLGQKTGSKLSLLPPVDPSYATTSASWPRIASRGQEWHCEPSGGQGQLTSMTTETFMDHYYRLYDYMCIMCYISPPKCQRNWVSQAARTSHIVVV